MSVDSRVFYRMTAFTDALELVVRRVKEAEDTGEEALAGALLEVGFAIALLR